MNSTSDPGSTEDRCRRLQHQISTLKHVASLRRSLLELRGKQAKGLISKLKFYEVIVSGEREARHSLSNRLESAEAQCGQLTERLSKNLLTIEDIKVNYENKASTLITEIQTSEQRNQQLSDQLNCAQLRITEVTKDNTMEELQAKLEEASKLLDEKDRLAKEMQKQMKRVWERNKMLAYQMSLLNNLFTETEGVTIDFEKIKTIGDIVRESQSYAEETEDVMSDEEFSERRPSVDLEDLLDSMEKAEKNPAEDIPGEESCYKSVDTKRGPQLVLSVSKTFIKLKDLILEKKSLAKEIDTLKTLNTKLESKVDKQEHRLYRVTLELNKTWSLVSKLKQQHKKLYNSEAVLRYELQEKRALLEKLKNELSASREKWRRVKQKNSQSQVEWEKLRDEFAQRRHESSQESGTFSEVVSVSSSGENEVAASEEEENGLGVGKNSGTNDLEQSKTLPISSEPTTSCDDNVIDSVPTTTETPTEVPEPTPLEEPDVASDAAAPEEDESEGGASSASAFSPVEDETSTSTEDPLEELVSQLVEDIDNEGDTEDENSSSASASAPRPPLETDSSPSPDFEDRMRRRANRLRMLEEQCHSLHQKLVASTERGVALSSKLAELHDHYGPSGSSSTGGKNDPQKEGDGEHRQTTSQIQDEVAPNAPSNSTNPTVTVTDEDAVSAMDAASASGPENNSAQAQDCQANLEEQPEPDKQLENGAGACSVEQGKIIESSSASTRDELISASENSSITVASSPPSSSSSTGVELENKRIPDEPLDNSHNETITQSQGHPNDDEAEVIIALPKVDIDNSLLTTVKGASSYKGDTITSHVCTDSVTRPTVPDAPAASASPTITNDLNVISPESSSRDLERGSEDNGNAEAVSNCDGSLGLGNDQDESLSRHHHDHHPEGDRTEQAEELQASLSSEQISNSNVEILPEASQPQASEEILAVEEPVPIIQETVVQHFPVTTEEEANEFAPVQIRPEFLRILQEADEATNVSSLDWMPSLLTITHSVALLRLDHDSPSVTRNNNNRSLSESLRIEIPRQSPSPPPATPHRREDNGGRSGTNHNDGHVSSTDEEVETERASASQRKDPGFLSRMIIKQLPKRLQLLKNENHTLQMEAAESKMRMKEMTRQLTKEVEKQQQLASSLDSQIDDKNLVEFELREELETKEKVIEELQVEIDASKAYVDELKKEKDDTEAFLKVFMDEKLDLERPKVSPDSVTNCNNCKRPFSLISRRKVHCKICGQVFCKDCALEREPNKRSSKRPRLCTCCHLRRLRLVVLVNASKQSSSAQPT